MHFDCVKTGLTGAHRSLAERSDRLADQGRCKCIRNIPGRLVRVTHRGRRNRFHTEDGRGGTGTGMRELQCRDGTGCPDCGRQPPQSLDHPVAVYSHLCGGVSSAGDHEGVFHNHQPAARCCAHSVIVDDLFRHGPVRISLP